MPSYNQELLEAAENGDFLGVKSAIESGAYVDTKDKNGRTALYIACGHDNLNISLIQYLLSKKASVKAIPGQYTPLHVAALSKNEKGTEVVRLLLRNGADPEAIGLDGSTPLYKASTSGNVETARLLLVHHASPNTTVFHNFTPLHMAAYKKNYRLVNLLLEWGADPEAKSAFGKTPQDDWPEIQLAKPSKVIRTPSYGLVKA